MINGKMLLKNKNKNLLITFLAQKHNKRIIGNVDTVRQKISPQRILY